jgi:hypothetical protein
MTASWIASGLLLAYSAMVALCQGLDRHYRVAWKTPASPQRYRLLRACGWLATTASLLCMVAAWGWAMGPVAWLGSLSLSGWLVALALPWWPRGLVAGALAGPLLGIASIIFLAVG